MGPKKKVTQITGEGFKGNQDLTLADIRKLSVEGFSPDLLRNITEDWTGGIAGIIGLTLSNDNKRIIEGRIILIGSLCVDKRVAANKFWEMEEQISLVFSINDGSIFSFPNGGMVSELVDGSLIPHSFYKGTEPVPDGTLPDAAIGFSLKCFIVPTRDTYAKLIILLYPLPKDMILNLHPHCTNPLFPGISLFTGEFPLIPQSSNPPLEKSWGVPFAPAILPGTPFEDSGNFPRTPLIRAAMGQILRKAIKPEGKSGAQNLIARWKEISEHGTSKLKESPLDAIWPLPSLTDFSEGRYSSFVSPPPLHILILICFNSTSFNFS